MAKRKKPAPGIVFAKRRGKGHYLKNGRIYFRVKNAEGAWIGVPSDFRAGQERAAEAMLREIEIQRAAGVEVVGDLGPVTVARYCTSWVEERKSQTAGWMNDESAMRLHVLPSIGKLRLDEVRPLHLIQIIKTLRKTHASKTVYNIYSTLCAFFRDACLADLLPRASSPCILTEHQLGPKRDADPEWRATAIYTRGELERFISDELVPMDRRVLYALECLGALRHGEAAGLRWRLVDSTLEPLGRIVVARSYNKPPKGGLVRYMPIHPTLAAILSEWKLFGWAQTMGRPPTPDDLVVPLPPTARRPATEGRIRSKTNSRDRLVLDLAALDLRHRRGHDFRRTMISLARSDGALKDILRRGTHKAPKEVMEQYTSFEWEVLCREVSKLKLQRRQTAAVVAIPRASAVGESGFATTFATTETQAMEIVSERRVGPPGFEPGRRSNPDIGKARNTTRSTAESAGYADTQKRPRPEKEVLAAPPGSKVANEPRALTVAEACDLRAALSRAIAHSKAGSLARAAVEEALAILDGGSR